jgi:predicted ArsR family transcriptional regulator
MVKNDYVCSYLSGLVMGFFDERILETLKDGNPRTFPALLGQVGFSHNTLQHHLERLTVKRLVVKQKTRVNGFGRPGFTYQIPPGSRKQVTNALEDPEIELVTIAFSWLRHVCRFEKGGYCKETRKNCTPQICPQTRK